MGAEPSITIGDIRAVCQAHYNATQRRLSFFEAMHMAFLQYPLHAPYDIPRHFMTPDEFQALIDQYVIVRLAGPETLPENIRKGPKPRKNFYINENEAFFPDKDVHAHIHIPYVCDGFHTHSHFEANYVYRGSAGAAVGNRDLTLKRGDFLIFAPNSAHNVQTAENDIVISIEMRRSSFEHIYELLFRNRSPLSQFFQQALGNAPAPAYALFHTDASHALQSIFQRIILEEHIADGGSNAIQANCLAMLFSGLVRGGYGHEIETVATDSGEAPDLGRILLFIKGNYQSVTLEMLSREFHYSRPYLSKFIYSQTGMLYRELLQGYKLERGRELLDSTQYSVEEVCGLIGYGSPSHFYRTFKAKYGVSPSAYRKKKPDTGPGR